MEQIGRIRRLEEDGRAQVIVFRESACSGDCHKCAGCGAQKEAVTFTAENPIGAKPGELVKVQSESGPVLAAAAVLYMMPVVLFFAGYVLGQWLWRLGALVGCISFVLGIVLAAVYDRKIAAKRATVYTVTGYPASGQIMTKGDNDLD